MPEPDLSRTNFWHQQWDIAKLPWDFGGIPTNLISFLLRNRTLDRVLIPGCGFSNEVRAFHEAGYDVTAIDVAASAVSRARELLGPLGDKVIHGNFFEHDFGGKRYDVVYERGFLCSLPHARWRDYASRTAGLLSPGGKIIGLFLYVQEPEAPALALTESEAVDLLGRYFHLVRTEPVEAPAPMPAGRQRWQEWEKFA